jgi:hypothetical protein
MANAERGEFDLTLGGQTYTFKLGFAALRTVQERFATGASAPTLDEIDVQVKRGRLLYIQVLLWAALRTHHPEVTESQVEDLIEAADQHEIKTLVAKVMGGNRPDPADVEALGAGRPTRAATDEGTGRQARKRARRSGGGLSILPPAASASAATNSGR